MEARVWGQLPLELVEKVLSFLPLPDIGRCRVVCKRWYGLIADPCFAALCLESAKLRVKGFGYVVSHWVVEKAENSSTFDTYVSAILEAHGWQRLEHGEELTYLPNIVDQMEADGIHRNQVACFEVFLLDEGILSGDCQELAYGLFDCFCVMYQGLLHVLIGYLDSTNLWFFACHIADV